jgi:hypothetical protein
MVLKMGPSGGISGQNAYDTTYHAAPGLAGIAVAWDDAIIGINLSWTDGNNFNYTGTNPRSDSTFIDVRNKRISKILGFIGWWVGYTVVKSIQFQFTDGTDTGWIGAIGSKPPYFTSPVLPFEYDVPLGLGLIGFFGNTGAVLDQIGFKFDDLPY